MMGSICSTTAAATANAATANTNATNTIRKPIVRSWESYTREQALGCPEIAESKNEKLTSITSLEKIPENPNDVIRDLENRQYPVVNKVLETNVPLNTVDETLTNFMKNGVEEFKERTGRPMTYAEMRAAWG